MRLTALFFAAGLFAPAVPAEEPAAEPPAEENPAAAEPAEPPTKAEASPAEEAPPGKAGPVETPDAPAPPKGAAPKGPAPAKEPPKGRAEAPAGGVLLPAVSDPKALTFLIGEPRAEEGRTVVYVAQEAPAQAERVAEALLLLRAERWPAADPLTIIALSKPSSVAEGDKRRKDFVAVLWNDSARGVLLTSTSEFLFENFGRRYWYRNNGVEAGEIVGHRLFNPHGDTREAEEEVEIRFRNGQRRWTERKKMDGIAEIR